jgi:hypothetical protein
MEWVERRQRVRVLTVCRRSAIGATRPSPDIVTMALNTQLGSRLYPRTHGFSRKALARPDTTPENTGAMRGIP